MQKIILNSFLYVGCCYYTLTDCLNRILGTGPWPGGGGLPSSLPAGSPQTAPDPGADRKHVDKTRFFVCICVLFEVSPIGSSLVATAAKRYN
jgi:hypothetical protein